MHWIPERCLSADQAWRRPARRAVAIGAGAVLWGELVHWRSSLRLLGMASGPSEAIVVLGYRDAGPDRPNAINRWRVRAAIRSVDPSATSSVLVFCGGTVGGQVSEAALMASYAHELGFAGQIATESESRSTWENIENAIPLVASADRIKIVSNSLHAEKARGYLHRQSPELARRLVRARDYRFGEWAALKPLFAAYGLWDLARTRRTSRTGQAGGSD